MNEREIPFEKAKFGKETVEMTPGNTSIYRHIGQYALFDHIFVHWPRPNGRAEGMGYIWSDSPLFAKFHELAILNSVAQHLNLPEVAELDYNNWLKHHTKDIDSDRPEWFEEV